MQEMKYFNEGNDCDICKNQLMTGRDGTSRIAGGDRMGCHADSRSVTFGHVRCANMRLIVRICISQRIVMESRSDWCVTDAIRESCQRI